MNYEEFSELEELFESKFVKCFRFPSGQKMYIEPAFYTQLMYLNQINQNDFPKVIVEMKRKTLEKGIISFVYDFENPFFPVNGSLYLEMTDVTDPIKVFYEDKSRGSDYGD